MSAPAAAAVAVAAPAAAAAPAKGGKAARSKEPYDPAAAARKREEEHRAAACAHNETAVAVFSAAVRELLQQQAAAAEAAALVTVLSSIKPYFATSEKVEISMLWPMVLGNFADLLAADKAFASADSNGTAASKRDRLELACKRLIDSDAVAVVGNCGLNYANAVADNKHVAVTRASQLGQLLLVKVSQKKTVPGKPNAPPEGFERVELEFVVAGAAAKFDASREEARAKIASRKIGGGGAGGAEAAAAAVAGAAASVVSGVKAVAAGVAAAVSAGAAAGVAAASASAASSSSPAVASSSPAALSPHSLPSAASSDYVVSTTQSVYNEMVLPALAKVLLLQGVSEIGAAPPSAALQAAAAQLSKEQKIALLGGKEGVKELLASQRIALGRADLTADLLLSSLDGAALASRVGAAKLVSALTPAQLLASLPHDARALLDAQLLPPLSEELIMFANQAYTKGRVAALKGKGNVPLSDLL